MVTRKNLHNIIEKVLLEESALFLNEVPFASHLTDEKADLDNEYYIRHRKETIKRIQMTAKTDALSLYYMIEEDYEAARKWSKYIVEELDHDRIFLQDLEIHGLSASQIAETPLFGSTIDLVDYLTGKIYRHGSLPAVAYSLYVEWNSNLYSRKTVEKARKKYSNAHIKGSLEHTSIDEELDHYEMMVDVTYRLLQKKNSLAELVTLLKAIGQYLRLYFTELYEETIMKKNTSLYAY